MENTTAVYEWLIGWTDMGPGSELQEESVISTSDDLIEVATRWQKQNPDKVLLSIAFHDAFSGVL